MLLPVPPGRQSLRQPQASSTSSISISSLSSCVSLPGSPAAFIPLPSRSGPLAHRCPSVPTVSASPPPPSPAVALALVTCAAKRTACLGGESGCRVASRYQSSQSRPPPRIHGTVLSGPREPENPSALALFGESANALLGFFRCCRVSWYPFSPPPVWVCLWFSLLPSLPSTKQQPN